MEQHPSTGHLPPYDDLLDTLARQGPRLDPAVWDGLVDRLAEYDVVYLAGGSADAGRASSYRTATDVDLLRLVRDLARAPEPRLRDALIALLLRHPEHAAAVRHVLATLPMDDPVRTSLVARFLVAAALQRRHYHVLTGALPDYHLIDVADLTTASGLPTPDEDRGKSLMEAVQRRIAGRLQVIDYVDGWEDVAQHTLRELRSVQPTALR
jgi:hypothetical protein